MKQYFVSFGLLVGLLAIVGCGDSPKSPPDVGERAPASLGDASLKPLALNFGIPPDAATGSVRVTDGTNELVINKVLMTLEDIDFERSDQSIDCGQVTNVDDHLDCSDYVPGPLLLDLDLTGTAKTLINLTAPVGTLEVISFDISVPDGGDPEQLAYLEANPQMKGISIRIEGTYNDDLFIFELDLRGDQEIVLDPPLVVTEDGGDFAVEILFDPRDWFLDDDDELIDPNAVCQVRRSCDTRDRIEDQVEQSIQSYSNL